MKKHRLRYPVCPNCDYNLTGIPTSQTNCYQCPECNEFVPEIDSIKLPWYIGSRRNHVLFTTMIPTCLFISGFFIFESDTNTLFKWESALTISTIAWLLIVPKQFSKLESNWTHGGYTRDATTVFFDTFIYSAIIIILVVLASWILLGMSVLGSIA